MTNQQLAKELHKPDIKKVWKTKSDSSFKENTWGADLANILLLSTHNKGFLFLLRFIDIFSKYTWAVPFKNKMVVQLLTLLKRFWMSFGENQTKYRSINVANSTTDQWNHGCKMMI